MGYIAHLRNNSKQKIYTCATLWLYHNVHKENWMVLICTNFSPLHTRMLYAKFGWNWPYSSWEEDFLISSMYFHYFVIISTWKRAGPFVWTNLNPLHPRMLCAMFGLNFVNVFSLLRIIFNMKMGVDLHLKKPEASSPKNVLCQVWMKLDQWF